MILFGVPVIYMVYYLLASGVIILAAVVHDIMVRADWAVKFFNISSTKKRYFLGYKYNHLIIPCSALETFSEEFKIDLRNKVKKIESRMDRKIKYSLSARKKGSFISVDKV